MDETKEYRCQHCNKLMFKANLVQAFIEVKCIKCKQFNSIQEGSTENLSCFDLSCPKRFCECKVPIRSAA